MTSGESAQRTEQSENTEIQQMDDSEQSATDGGLPANPSPIHDLTPTEKIESTADGLSAFNSVLWEIAKTFAILTAIFLMVFFLFMAYQIAKWGMTTL